MFNVLLDSLPDEFRGAIVRTDFRQALKFFRIVASKDLEDWEKARLILSALFETLPDDCAELWEFVEHYISGGQKGSGQSEQIVFDFNIDAGRVYAAFRQVYGLDLRQEQMHWWIFLELFRALPEGTQLSKVIEIRAKKTTKDMDEDSKRALRKAKRAYAIQQDAAPNFSAFLRG